MSSEQVWMLAGGAFALASLVAVLVVRRAAARSGEELAAARAEARALADRLAAIEQSMARERDDVQLDEGRTEGAQSYVITHLGDHETEAAAPAVGRIDGRLFADIVARESAVKAAGVVHGLRRALAPEVRNRIRFEMRREVHRARKQRRSDLKTALREFRARERAYLTDPDGERPDRRHDEGDAA